MPDITKPPKVFISYAWEDDVKTWVRALAKRLRKDGVETILDQWETDYGDQLPEFMERAVRDSDFVILICTPKYKKKSDERQGGVGYEGHIITAEIFEKNNHRKFIPVLRKGNWIFSAPSWAAGKLYIDLGANPYSEENYRDLLKTLHGKKPTPPPVGTPPDFPEEDMDNDESPNLFAGFYARLKEFASISFARLKSALPEAVSFLKFTGFAGLAIGLFWAGWRFIPPFIELLPTPEATTTFSIRSPDPPTKTRVPDNTATPAPTRKIPFLPTATKKPTATSNSTKISSKDGAKMIYIRGWKDVASFWIDQTAVTTSMFEKFVKSTGYVTDAENNGVGFVWTFLGEQAATQFPGQTGVVYEWKLLSGVNWKNPPDNQYSDDEVLQVSWNDATAYCKWAGRELLTVKEWELARASTLPITFYNSPDGLGEWAQDKTSGIYRAVLGRQDIKWGGYTTYVFQGNGFIEYRSADRLTFRCKGR